MKLILGILFVLCFIDATVSEFTGAVYEHVFISLKNRTEVPTREEALRIVMDNMNVYEQQILIAKAQVTKSNRLLKLTSRDSTRNIFIACK